MRYVNLNHLFTSITTKERWKCKIHSWWLFSKNHWLIIGRSSSKDPRKSLDDLSMVFFHIYSDNYFYISNAVVLLTKSSNKPPSFCSCSKILFSSTLNSWGSYLVSVSPYIQIFIRLTATFLWICHFPIMSRNPRIVGNCKFNLPEQSKIYIVSSFKNVFKLIEKIICGECSGFE